MPKLELDFTIPLAFILLLIIVAATTAFLFYRYTLPPVSRTTRTLLSILRSISLALVLMLLFEPLFRLVVSSLQPPVLAVLADNSRSMAIVDRLGNRAAQVYALLAKNTFEHMNAGADIRYYTFGSKLHEASNVARDSLSFGDDATNISEALRALAGERERKNIKAAIILSDGSYTVGQNPVYEAEQLGIPLYTVGIGDSSEQKDVLISRVATNDLVYNETATPVDIIIKSSGYSGDRVEVTLSEGMKQIARAQFLLESGTREYATRLLYMPEGEGTKKYIVSVSPLPGELTVSNNQKSFFAKVLKNRSRILLLAGGPGPDLTILKQTLGEDRTITARSFTQRVPSGFYEGPLTQNTLDSSDCIITINFPTSTTTASTLEMLRNAVVEKGKPLFFISGPSINYQQLRIFATVLPFGAEVGSMSEEYIFFEPSLSQKTHPILNLGSTESFDAWKRLPPLFKTETVLRSKPEATVLGLCRVQNIVLQEPLILVRNINRQKSLAVAGYGLWRWRLMAQGSSSTSHVLATFLSNGIRWLTTREEGHPVKVVTSKEAFMQGEPVQFIGQVYDASARPVENAEIRVAARQGEREFETTLRPIGSGRYEGVIDGVGPGDYTFHAEARAEAVPLGDDRGRFSVGELNLEFQDTRMNATLLRQLAYRSGGEFYMPNDVKRLSTALAAQPSFASRNVIRTTSLELWNWNYMLAAIVLLLSTEWVIRKRRGML